MDDFGEPVIFLTSVALLTAILVVWAQQWLSTYKIYKDRILRTKCTLEYCKRVESSSNVWLGWIYLAILSALLAFVLAALSYLLIGWDCLLKFAMGFSGVSLYMTLVQVTQSCVSAVCKFCKGKPLDEPVSLPSPCQLKIIMSVLIVLGVFIFGWIEASLWRAST